MSETFLDPCQTVGYDFHKKVLVVTLSEKMAKKMTADGWQVGHDEEIGHFIYISLE